MRKLTEKDVEFTLECLPEFTPIEGNCCAIDEETDRRQEQLVRDQLEAGNDWAWCCVKVSAKWEGFEGTDFLGCCSYESEEQFKQPGGYYEDMLKVALDDLNAEIEHTQAKIKKLEEQSD